MAFLPQFVREGYGDVPFQLMYLGLLIIVVAIIVEVIYVLAASILTQKLRSSQRFSLWLERFVGTVFVVLGVKLVADS